MFRIICFPKFILLSIICSIINVKAYNILAIAGSNNTRVHGGEEKVQTGEMLLDSSDYELMHEVGKEQIVGIVFPKVSIDPKMVSRIQSINVLFDIKKIKPASMLPIYVSIHGELNPNAAKPSLNQYDISSRVLTQTAIIWELPPSTQIHEKLLTPDISIIVKEIISLPQWSIGNPVCIIFKYMSGDGTRWVESSRLHAGIQTPALVWNVTPLITIPTINNISTAPDNASSISPVGLQNNSVTETETNFLLVLEQVAMENLDATGAAGSALGSVIIGGLLYKVYKSKSHESEELPPPQELVVIKPDFEIKTTQYVVVSNKNNNFTVFTKKINEDPDKDTTITATV